MPENNQAKANATGVNEQQAKTRLLLALWDMGANHKEVMKGQLTKRVVQKNLKASDYQGIFDQLEKEEAIADYPERLSLSQKN